MRYSRLFMPTLREDPAEAEVVSHKLCPGRYDPQAGGRRVHLSAHRLKVMRKVQQIVREELTGPGPRRSDAGRPAVKSGRNGRWFAFGRDCFVSRTARHRLLSGPHPRGSDHRPGAPGSPLLPDLPNQPLSFQQKFGTNPAPVRPDAQPRIRDEGRLHHGRGRRGGQQELLAMSRPTPASSSAAGSSFIGGGRLRSHRRQLFP